jgi:putative selenium metabolism hydrolase
MALASPDLTARLTLNPGERAEMLAFLQDLIQMPSLSGQEKAVAGLVKGKLREIGVEEVSIDPAGNVIARLGDGDGPTLVVDAHLDTVALTDQTWAYDPFAAVVVDGVVYGLGACDVKGSIAALIYGVKRLIDSGVAIKGNLVMVFVVQEEPCEGCSLRAALEHAGIRPDWVLLCEPSDMKIMLGHRGRVMFKVNVQGRSSHAANPGLGENAIFAAARLIFGIDMLAGGLGHDPFMGDGSITITHIESQAASLNAVPDSCTFYVDRRLTLGETASRARAQLEAIIDREDIKADLSVVTYDEHTYTGYPLRAELAFNTWQLAEDHPLVGTVREAVKGVRDKAPLIGHWPFSTDGVYSMGEAKIPTIGFGPGDPHQVHSPEEQVRISDVEDAATIYALIAHSLLNTSPGK